MTIWGISVSPCYINAFLQRSSIRFMDTWDLSTVPWGIIAITIVLIFYKIVLVFKDFLFLERLSTPPRIPSQPFKPGEAVKRLAELRRTSIEVAPGVFRERTPHERQASSN